MSDTTPPDWSTLIDHYLTQFPIPKDTRGAVRRLLVQFAQDVEIHTRHMLARQAPPVMTREAFEEGYAARSGFTVQELRAQGRTVIPCDCGAPSCEGWQSVSHEEADEPE